jgi:Phage terminase large subunit (GpA)
MSAADAEALLGHALVKLWTDAEAAGLEQRIAFRDWAMPILEPKTGRLDFTRFPFQVELYELPADDAEVVIMKSTQVGVSAWLVRLVMFLADTGGLTCLYVFPKATQLADFSDARIRPLILGSHYLRSRIANHNVQNKNLKQIGRGFVYFRGSESNDGLDAVDADVLALDEYDSLTQANIPDAERRITGSCHPMIRRVGVPSVPGFGISKLYAESDQRKWHVRCNACREWQTIDFYDNVDQEALTIVCRRCRKPLDVGTGEWVATYPDRSVKGYQISRLLVPGTDLARLVNASREREPYRVQAFWNKDLGLDYAPEEGRLSLAALQAAQRDYTTAPSYTGANLVTAGVDVASTRALNVRISEHHDDGTKTALYLGTADSFEDLAVLIKRYRVNMCAIDHMPERRSAQALAERFPGRVYLVSYATPGQKDLAPVDEDRRCVSVRRTEAIDTTLELIRLQSNLLPQGLPDGYVAQMQAAVRYVDKNEMGKVTVVYRSTGHDDYLHAETMDVVATYLCQHRTYIEERQEEVLVPLDDLVPFRRSDVNDYNNYEYRPGPGEPPYHPGSGDGPPDQPRWFRDYTDRDYWAELDEE